MNFLINIWNKIKTFFVSKNNGDNVSIIKRFKIDNSVNVMADNSNRKKFQITNERNVPKRDEKFNIINRSRPLRCGVCGSEKTYIKVGNSWECKICKNKINA